jgi:EpsI family protein
MLLRCLSLACSFLVLLLMAAEGTRRPSPATAAPFHKAAAAAIAAVPLNLGDWAGTDIPVPASAQTLLRPNAMLSRAFTQRGTGEALSLALVQCRDTRDMAGHYPPICYPGQGWAQGGEGVPVTLSVGPHTVRATRYQFTRGSLEGDRTLVIYNFFAVPGEGFLADMAGIRTLASRFTARPFGAAQIQVVFGRSRPTAEEVPLVQDILNPLADVLTTLTDPAWRSP